MYELVRIGLKRQLGEIIKLEGDKAQILCFDDTMEFSEFDEVVGTGSPLSVELGPGVLNSVYDGIQRPL
jgi:V/A-type H+-transporting ATPase subunit A